MKKNLRCDCAAHTPFAAVELMPGLAAQQCASCEAAVVEMSDYRRWSQRSGVSAVTPGSGDVSLLDHETTVARSCPSCDKLMQRLRTGTQPGFRVDRCHVCQLVWFDRGEWPALVQAGLAGRLGEVLSDAWQKQAQTDELRAGREATLRARHGDACMDELARMRTWLDTQPSRDELLSLLRAGW
jgi:Zn-finger nucleic acid-binding protein